MENKLIKLESPAQLQVFSNTLKRFIITQKLFSEIKGKNYVNVEGWEFAGAATGLSPMVKSVINESNEKETKYRAEVELVNTKGEIVGFGMAICSNKEMSKKSFDEYAIASMAQTRAIGKAFRNKLAFLMKMAGYEPTPAEEVEEVKPTEKEMSQEESDKPATINQKELLLNLAKQKGVEIIVDEKITNAEVIAKIKELSEMKKPVEKVVPQKVEAK